MTYQLTFYIVTLLISASWIFTWFNSTLPNLVLAMLKKFGVKKKDPDFWNVVQLEGVYIPGLSPMAWTKDDLAEFFGRLGLVGELLQCRYCLCYHVVFWSNLVAFIACWVIGGNVGFLTFLSAVFSQPILVHLIYNLTARLGYYE